jgi:2-oxoisovalerate dehydrogenase E1 component alpha subunit
MAVLRPEDEVAPSDRSLVVQSVAGVTVKAIFKQLLSAGNRLSAAPPGRHGDAPLGYVSAATRLETQVAVATGIAFAYKRNQESEVVLSISGKEWSGSDELRAALEFAASNRLPIVYVANNDTTLYESQSENEKVTTMAQTCGVTVITVDGSDAVAVYRVASESISRARKGVGPTVIHCRFLPAPASHRRSSLRHVDPLVHMEHYMRKRDAWSDSWKQGLIRQFTREIESAVKFAERASAAKKRVKG